jgi:hypothetical protein
MLSCGVNGQPVPWQNNTTLAATFQAKPSQAKHVYPVPTAVHTCGIDPPFSSTAQLSSSQVLPSNLL